MYNPQMGKFFSPDPGGARTARNGRPLTWNRYLYANGDPINFFDPAGMEACDPGMEGECGGNEFTDCEDCEDDTDQEGGGSDGSDDQCIAGQPCVVTASVGEASTSYLNVTSILVDDNGNPIYATPDTIVRIEVTGKAPDNATGAAIAALIQPGTTTTVFPIAPPSLAIPLGDNHMFKLRPSQRPTPSEPTRPSPPANLRPGNERPPQINTQNPQDETFSRIMKAISSLLDISGDLTVAMPIVIPRRYQQGPMM